jgi:ribosomal protein S18 acetylase RimI-like enzyme
MAQAGQYRGISRAARTNLPPAASAGDIAGFLYLLNDGEVQAYIATMAVHAGSRGRGIGTRLIQEAFAACGARRIDLLSGADGFYEKLLHQRLPGFRLYPPFARGPAEPPAPSEPD